MEQSYRWAEASLEFGRVVVEYHFLTEDLEARRRFLGEAIQMGQAVLQGLEVGETFTLELELVNAGRSPAMLVKLEGLIAEGLLLESHPEPYRLGDGSSQP